MFELNNVVSYLEKHFGSNFKYNIQYMDGTGVHKYRYEIYSYKFFSYERLYSNSYREERDREICFGHDDGEDLTKSTFLYKNIDKFYLYKNIYSIKLKDLIEIFSEKNIHDRV